MKITCSVHAFNLIAFLSVLVAIVALSLKGKPDLAIMTGLIGILGSFKPWGLQAPPDGPLEAKLVNSPADPVPTKEATP